MTDLESGAEIWPASPIAAGPSARELTGHAEDDEILRQVAARSSLDKPRDWQHFLLVPGEDAAHVAGRALQAAGWSIDVAPPDEDDDVTDWCVIAEMTGVVLTPGLVRTARTLFETVAAQIPGADYDGWQANIDFDDYLPEDA
jgi:hypothetical protein